jgi:hypothetical protein
MPLYRRSTGTRRFIASTWRASVRRADWLDTSGVCFPIPLWRLRVDCDNAARVADRPQPIGQHRRPIIHKVDILPMANGPRSTMSDTQDVDFSGSLGGRGM